jgi:hypothetical protein
MILEELIRSISPRCKTASEVIRSKPNQKHRLGSGGESWPMRANLGSEINNCRGRLTYHFPPPVLKAIAVLSL